MTDCAPGFNVVQMLYSLDFCPKKANKGLEQ